MPKTIEIIESTSQLASIADEWNILAEKFQTPLLRYEWFCSSAEAFCPPGKLLVLIERTDNEITAIAPLVTNQKYTVKRLELLGASVLSEPGGFLYKDTESLKNIIQKIVSFHKPIYLEGLLSTSSELEFLKNKLEYSWRYKRINSFAAPWIPITTDWGKYYSTISSRWRSTLRRAERRAKEFGKMEFEFIEPDVEMVEKHLPEIFKVEMSGWKSRIGTALQTYSVLGKFFTLYAKAAAKHKMLRIAYLRIDSKAVAVQLLVEYANRMWVLKIGYDEEYARCSPGILLMNDVIHRSFDKQLESFEFLGTNQPWLNIWPNKLHVYENYRLYPFTPNAILSHCLEKSSRLVNKFKTIAAKKHKMPQQSSVEHPSDND